VRPLTALDVVTIWDRGQALHPIDRALLLLGAGLPEADPTELQNLTVGQRNSRLLQLRQLTIGNELTGLVDCPRCGETLEFSVAVSQLRLPEPTTTTYTVSVGEQTLLLRLPTSADLAALLVSPDVDHARRELINRCVQPVAGSDEQPDLTANMLAEVAELLAKADPQADMRFALSCADCGHDWHALFDIVSFFWTELAAQAKRLLLDVHQLARAYGWRESEILALSSRRRQTYLEMIGA